MVQYQPGDLDSAFAALADPTRRAILDRLGEGPASISELAEPFEMSLTGLKKHVRILEEAGLVTTEKVGRTRVCKLGPGGLDGAQRWIDAHGRTLAARLDRLADLLEEESKGEKK